MTISGKAAGRVDIHSHILPQVDDGARDLVEALDMLRMAREDGTSTIVATPHGTQANPERIKHATELLRLESRKAGIEIEILGGSEVKFSANLAEDYQAGKLVTINDAGYMLVEFSFSRAWTSMVHTSLYALQMAGITPIIAHAERYPVVQENPSVLLELVAMGIPVQINAGSLLGQDGVESRRIAELLVRARMVHILASDGHRRDTRKPVLKCGFARAVELADYYQVLDMEQNATHIINGHGIRLPEPDISVLKPRSRAQRIFKRLSS